MPAVDRSDAGDPRFAAGMAPPLPLPAGDFGLSAGLSGAGVAEVAVGEITFTGIPRVSERMRAISWPRMAVLPRSTVTICIPLDPPASPIALSAASTSAIWSLVPLMMMTLRAESPSIYGPAPVRDPETCPSA